MINPKAINEIEALTKEYIKIYGKEPDLNDQPLPGLTSEMLVELLKIMTAENKSLISAYSDYNRKRKSGENGN